MEQDLSATPVSDPTVTSQFDAWAIGNTIFHWKHKESELEFSGDIDAFNFYLKSKIQSGEFSGCITSLTSFLISPPIEHGKF